jgi:putative membrane protein
MYGHNQMMWGIGAWWMAIFWILVIIGIFFLVKWLVEQGKGSRNKAVGEDSALEILKRRYAKGEIDKQEFEQKKKDLTG